MCFQDHAIARNTDSVSKTSSLLGASAQEQLFGADGKRLTLIVTVLWQPPALVAGDALYVYAGDPANGKILGVITEFNTMLVIDFIRYGQVMRSAIFVQTASGNAQNLTVIGTSIFMTATEQVIKQET